MRSQNSTARPERRTTPTTQSTSPSRAQNIRQSCLPAVATHPRVEDLKTRAISTLKPGPIIKEVEEVEGNDAISTVPLFLIEHKLAYDHEMGFSIDGGPFKDGLPYAHLKAGVTKVYELVKQTYPAKAQALEISFLDSAPDGKSRQERLKLLYPQTRSYTETLKVPESPKPKISWDKLDLPNKSTFVDTVEKLAKFLEIIQAVKDLDPDIFCDCEGDNLGRNGTFSLLQVMIAPKDHTWIIDITVLKDKAFDTRGPGLSGRTLREIMEDSQILKIFYDVRNDADAFFSHYKIYLRGIIDMQFMELAIRVSDRRRRVGLDTCMARVLMSKERMAEISMRKLDWDTAALWQYHKTAGQNYCKGEKGWAVYDERPLLPVLLRYAINDVVLLPALFAAMSQLRGLNRTPKGHQGKALAKEQSQAMVENSILSDYNPDGPRRDKTVAPRQFEEWRDDDDRRRDRNKRDREEAREWQEDVVE